MFYFFLILILKSAFSNQAVLSALSEWRSSVQNHSWSSFIDRRSEYKGFYESLQNAFPNNVLDSQFRGWNLVCSIDVPRCLIIDCFYGPRYVSHPPFSERSANLLAHWLCASTTASYTLVYLWKCIDYYGKREMADASMFLERSKRESTHIMVCSSLHGREGRSQQSSLAFKATWIKEVFFTLPFRNSNQSMS